MRPINLAALILICSMGLTSCKPAVLKGGKVDSARLNSGVFEGSDKHNNSAKVQITIADNKITEIKVVKLGASPWGQKAQDSIPVRIIREQSTIVDAVTGATEASNVIMNAVDAAVQKSYDQAK